MRDGFGRKIDYMRISITDCCNLRCKYCMPQEMETAATDRLLTFEEIQRVVTAGVELGIIHYRLTGGEPLVRHGCAELVRRIKQTSGVETVTMTTNGVLLAENAEQLTAAGIDGINVSLDTVDEKEFEQLTGKAALPEVKAGIEAGIRQHIPIKINTVNRKETDVNALLAYAEKMAVPVRFIEMMPIGYGREYGGASNQSLLKKLEADYGRAEEISRDEQIERLSAYGKADFGRRKGQGPAVYYHFPDLKQPVGFISAVNQKFCDDCNRVRLSSEGYLKLCLCYEKGLDLREILRSSCEPGKLTKVMEQAIIEKPGAHCFEDSEGMTERHVMRSIGG